MDHLAIMRKSWGLTGKITTGQKTVESRWYKTKYPPWDRIKAGDTVYFKDSGSPVTIKAAVEDVKQFSGLNPAKVRQILGEYHQADGIEEKEVPKFFEMFKDKKYCILVFLGGAEKTKPFDIDKNGFGSMSSWLVLDDIGRIRKSPG